MSFQFDTTGMPRITYYAEALARWEGTIPWRNASDTNTRPLDSSRRKKHVTIRKLADGSIACRLHYTDVVVWHPNNSFTITPYSSRSTDDFARELIPDRLSPHFNTNPFNMVRFGHWGTGTLIQLTGPTRFVCEEDTWGAQVWSPAPGATLGTFRRYTMNRKRANAALKKYNYKAFVNWFEVRQALLGNKEQPWRYLDDRTVPTLLLEGVDGWHRLATSHMSSTRIIYDIYEAEKVANVETFTSIPTSLLSAIVRSQHMSEWAL